MGVIGNLSFDIGRRERGVTEPFDADHGYPPDAARGSGLAGLAQRVSTVDGRIDVSSPPGGPTTVSVELPLKA